VRYRKGKIEVKQASEEPDLHHDPVLLERRDWEKSVSRARALTVLQGLRLIRFSGTLLFFLSFLLAKAAAFEC
jgi:hypothetical protein